MKIAICTPVYSDPSYNYTVCLANLLLYSAKAGLDLTYIAGRGAIVTVQRNRLAAAALEQGADYVLWLDSDQTFPGYSLERLLSHRKAIVGCNYARREEPTGPTAGMMKDGRLTSYYTTPEQAKAGVVEEVSVLGLGACLTSREALQAVGSPVFADRDDYDFCLRAKEAGIPVYLDHALSWEIGHVREEVATNLHALMDRARFKLKNNLT